VAPGQKTIFDLPIARQMWYDDGHDTDA
jgi:hypothetical protein